MLKITALKSILVMTLITLALAWMPVTSSWAAFSLAAEANPNPVDAGQLLDVQISVSTTSLTGALTLRVLWPAGLGSTPYVAGGGGCSGSCGIGEYLTWNLGVLGANNTITVSFNENVLENVVDGTAIPIEIELLEAAVEVENLSLEVEVQSDSPLELAVDPLSDPVSSGTTLVYEIVYGNTSSASAENSELEFPIPAGTQFASATGGGVFAAGKVKWNLGSIPANSGGRQRVTVQLDALAAGTLLVADAATLSGTVNFLSKTAEAMAVSRVATEALELELEVNPDQVNPGQMMDTQITISNPTEGATGTLTLRVLWPEELGSSPYQTGGGTCTGGCDEGEYLNWNLGVLGPATSITIGFNENVLGNVASGSLVPIEVELLEGALPARTRSHTVIVQTDSPLELAVDPLSDPVSSGATLAYEIVYGNTSSASAENSELEFPVPAGTQFVSATGDGVFAAGKVSWNLGSIPANSGGRQRVTVQLDALDTGTLLLVDASTLSGTVNFLPKTAEAMAVSRVATEALELELEINPDRVNPGQLMDSQITISNPTEGATGTLTLRVLWPEELGSSPYQTGGGTCTGGCDEGEYLNWNLGVLGPATSITIGFNENVLGNVASGSLVPIEVELLEGALPARTRSHTVIVQTDSPLELAVDPLSDPVSSGATLAYEIVYGNTSSASAENSELEFPVPAGTQFVSATGDGVFAAGKVSWNLGSIPANSGGRQRVTVQLDALDTGTLLLVDASTLSGTVNFLPKTAEAMAVSRVATEALELDMDVNSNPILAGQILSAEINIHNSAGIATGTLILRLLWPEELGSSPSSVGGATCSGGCDDGEYLTWNIGTLVQGNSVMVSFSENVLGIIVNGTLIPLEFELVEASLPARNISQTVLVNPFTDHDNDGEADVFDEDDDNDGMPDWWEILHELDPFDDQDADDDPDMDGLTNLEEFLAGSDPNFNEDLMLKDGFEDLL